MTNAILKAAAIVPNWASSELPLADYGAVAAIKLVTSALKDDAKSYVFNDNTDAGLTGKYHFYLLGRGYKIPGNVARRAALEAAPTKGRFEYVKFDKNIEFDGVNAYRNMMSVITELARVYNLQPRLVIGAFLNLVHEEIEKIDGYPKEVQGVGIHGFLVAKYNPSSLSRLWGTYALGYPGTYQEKFQHMQARNYSKKRRRY